MATALGLDFGTTNTVLAQAGEGADTASVTFTSPAETGDTMRTALSFIKDAQLGASALQVEAGQAAIGAFIANPGECRYLQSIKTFAASALFQGTFVHARRFQFEDLMEVFLKRLEAYAGDNWPDAAKRIVTGRPVHFAGANPDSDLAMRRYSEALGRLGFPELHYVYEPVAAAFYFAQNLSHDATVLVADFGGGTSDFSLIRFETDFEDWISADLARITSALDEVLDKTQTQAADVDRIFLTGGTSFVPAVRRIFTDRFDAGRIETGGELISIAHGLALIGERDDIAQWTVPVSA